LTVSHRYKESFQIKDFTVTFYDAGHIPGSCVIAVEAGNRRLLYTGDINGSETGLLNSSSRELGEANMVITESTYATADHPARPVKPAPCVRGRLAESRGSTWLLGRQPNRLGLARPCSLRAMTISRAQRLRARRMAGRGWEKHTPGGFYSAPGAAFVHPGPEGHPIVAGTDEAPNKHDSCWRLPGRAPWGALPETDDLKLRRKDEGRQPRGGKIFRRANRGCGVESDLHAPRRTAHRE